MLADGRILVAGGHSGVDGKGIVPSELYDTPATPGRPGPDMRNGRWYPTNTTLASGEVLTISGGDTAGVVNMIPEVWSPGGSNGQGSWRALTTATASLPYFPMMFVAPNGTAYVAGPNQSTGYLNTSGTGGWTAGPNRTFGGRDYGSAVMYDAGKILVGGWRQPDAERGGHRPQLRRARRVWRRVDSMAVPRRQMNATLLADGTVLATGGSNAAGFNTKPTDDQGPRRGAVGSDDRKVDGAGPADPLPAVPLDRACCSPMRGCCRSAAASPRPRGSRTTIRGRRSRRPTSSSWTGPRPTARRSAPPPTTWATGRASRRHLERGSDREGHLDSSLDRDPRDQHEPADELSRVHRERLDAHGHGAGERQPGAAWTLHAVHRGRERSTVDREDHTDQVIAGSSSTWGFLGVCSTGPSSGRPVTTAPRSRNRRADTSTRPSSDPTARL